MAKKLELDDFDLDSGLDFNFDADVSSDLSEESQNPKNRNPVINVVRGAAKGAVDTARDPVFIKETLRKSMPSTYGEIATAAGETLTSGYELYDETAKELKPRLARISEKIDRLLPENMTLLRKLNDKFGKWMGREQDTGFTPVGDQEDQAVNSMLGAIFQQNKLQARAVEGKQLLRDRIDEKRFASSTQLLGTIAQNTSIVTQYTTEVTQGYQKKMLELSLRGYLMQKEHFTQQARYAEMYKAQLESIVKNTALPEFQKITLSERFWETTQKRGMNALYGEGSLIQRGLGRLKSSAKQFVGGIGMALDNADFALDSAVSGKEQVEQMNEMLVEMGEAPLTKAEMAGAALAGGGVSYLRDLLAKRLKTKTEGNKGLTEGLAKMARVVANPAGSIESLRQTDDWQDKMADYETPKGRMYRFFDFFLEHFTDDTPNRRIEAGGKLDELGAPTMGFDNKAHVSLVDVIPGHLAAIHREIFMLRTGDDDAPLRTFDFARKEFVTQAEMGERITKQLSQEVKQSSMTYFLEQSARDFVGGRELPTEQQTELKRFLGRLSRIPNMDYTPDAITATRAYDALDPETRAIVDERLDALRNAEKPEEELLKLTKSIQSVRSTTPSLSRSMESYVRAGYGDLIEKAGLMKKTETGDYDVDEEAFERFLEEHSLVRSDINVKQAISRMNPAELLATVKERFKQGATGGIDQAAPQGQASDLGGTKSKWSPRKAYDGIRQSKLFRWLYQPGVGDDQEHFGPMAQDVNRNLGEEAAPGGKSIDLQSMNGASMAAIQHLGGEVESLKKAGANTDVLERIKGDTGKIVEQLSQGVGGGGGLGGIALPGPNAGYGDLLSATIRNVIELGIKAGNDVITGAGKAFDTVHEKVGKPVFDFFGRQYSKYKEPVQKALGNFFEGAMDMAGKAVEMGKNFFSDALPAGMRQIKNFAKSLWKRAKDEVNKVRDLYLPDGTEPIVRAVKLRAGFYRDAATDKIITSIDELMAAKGDIVDSAGNVIVSLEEKAQGLYDRYGDRVMSTGKMLVSGVVGLAHAGAVKIGQGINALLEGAGSATGRLKHWWQEKTQGFNWSKYGFGGMTGEANDAIIDIRSILLGDSESVRERLKLKDTGKSPLDPTVVINEEGAESASTDTQPKAAADLAKRYVGGGGAVGKAIDVATNLAGKAKAKATEILGGRQEGESLTAYAKRGMTTARDKLRDRWTQAAEAAPAATTASRIDWAASKGQMTQPGATGGLLGKLPLKGKLGTLARGARGILGGAASALGGAVGGLLGGAGGAGGDAQAAGAEEAVAFAESPSSDTQPKRRSRRVLSKDAAYNDTDGDGLRDGSVEAQREKQEELKEARKKKAAEADLRERYGSSENVIDTMMNKLGGLFDLVKGGIGGLFEFGKGILGKIPGLGKLVGMATSVGSGVVKGALSLAKGATSLIKPIGGGIGRAALQVAKFGAKTVLRATLFTTGATLSGVASAATAVASGVMSTLSAVVASPVILPAAAIAAATAAAGYGLWKLYKYAARNNMNDFERIRLLQYGFAYNESVLKYNHHVYGLEAYLCDGRIAYTRGVASLNDRKIKTEEMLEFFDIDPKDEEMVERFTTWFQQRFKPVFLTHLTALFAVDDKADLDKVHKLTPDQQLKFLNATSFEAGPYNVDTSPLKALESLNVDPSLIQNASKALIAQIQGTLKQTEGKPTSILVPQPKKAEEAVAKPKPATPATPSTAPDTPKAAAAQAQANTEANQAKPANEPITGEDGPSSDKGGTAAVAVNKLDTAPASAPTNIPVAAGAPLDGHGGRQFLKLGKNVNIDGLRPTVLQRFLGMVEEFGTATGKTVQVNDGYRSYEQQAALYKKYPQKAARPGRSLHEFGLAIDINSAEANEMEKLGLMKKYGFTRPVGGEAWHLEPAGIQPNLEKAKQNTAESELMLASSLGRGGGGYGTLPNSTRYRRNHQLAMQLLNLPGKETEVKQDPEAMPVQGAVAVSMPEGQAATATVSGAKVLPANDEATPTEKQFTDAKGVSEAQKLPSPDAVQSSTNTSMQDEGEDKPFYVEDEGGEATDPKGDLKAQIASYARKAGEDPTILQAFAAVESDMNPRAKAPGTSARGLHQFVDATWNEEIRKHGPKYGLSSNASRFEVGPSTLMAAEYIKNTRRVLGGVKDNPTFTDLYLGHFLGAGGAKTFLKADPSVIGAELMPTAARNNRNIFYENGRAMTVGQIYEGLNKKLKEKSSRYGINIQTAGLGMKAGQGEQGMSLGASETAADAFKPMKGETVTPTSSASAATTPAASTAPSPTTVSYEQAAKQEPKKTRPFFQSQSGGVFMDAAGNSSEARERREAGENLIGPNLTRIEVQLGKSHEVHVRAAELLEKIYEEVRIDKLAPAIAAASAAAAGKADGQSMKDQDRLNMGRTSQVNPAALDVRRKIA